PATHAAARLSRPPAPSPPLRDRSRSPGATAPAASSRAPGATAPAASSRAPRRRPVPRRRPPHRRQPPYPEGGAVHTDQTLDVNALDERVRRTLGEQDLAAARATMADAGHDDLVATLERLSSKQRAIAFRLLPKGRALEVFESFPPSLRGELVQGLRDAEVAEIFAALEPDDRAWLLDELPAS